MILLVKLVPLVSGVPAAAQKTLVISLGLQCGDVLGNLLTKRPWVRGTPDKRTYDPRFLVFEFTTGMMRMARMHPACLSSLFLLAF